ncbi:hypothetical protein [Portibacter marinus]|uniref:hypothetical protein n=1 Tax=Portibacter marinus TaxID=2898660 RepID=UPI001F417124|nr:hypothetical protein [Portibacter marinus]
MKNIYYLVGFIIALSSCSRDFDQLELATYPDIPEVYIDGFSPGLNYAAFGGSKVTAFDVDTETKYRGTSSMKFAVPDAGDPGGAYAGGGFYTDIGRDLTDYDALTFWAKASKSATIDIIGFGNDLGESRYVSSISNLRVNTNWTKYYIPIADASKLTQESGMLFYSEGPENGMGYTFWLDEVQFEKLGTIAHPKASILDGQDQVISAETGDERQIGGTTVSFNLPTGVDQVVNVAPAYFDFNSSEPTIASVNELGVVKVLDQGNAVITATLQEIDADGSLTITSSGQAVRPQIPAPMPTVSADSVISMFSNVYNNVTVDTWNPFWEFSTTAVEDIQVDGNDIKRYSNLNFVGILTESDKIDASNMTHFHIDIWTPNSTAPPASFKVLIVDFGADGNFGGGDDSSHELSFNSPLLRTEEWVSIDVPLSNFTGLINRNNIAQLVLSGDLSTVFVDNVYYYNSGTESSTGPASSSPNPNRNESSVISIFSDTYTNVNGTDFNPDWGQSTSVSQISLMGNNTLLYSGLNYQGTQFAAPVDASEMTHIHLDFWSQNSFELNFYLISPGPTETGFSLNVPTSGWTSIDIPLSTFSPVDLAEIIQLKFDGNGDIYLDNIYFFKEGENENVPSSAAPEPFRDESAVRSLFSDAYANVDGTNLNPDWGQATQVSELIIDDNNTLLYSGLNYQGMELGSSQNVTEFTHIHIDYWSNNSTALSIFLISPGPAETPFALSVPTSGWSSVDIPLSEFSAVDLSEVFQLKFEGNGDIYIDNLYFYKE